MQAVHNQRQMRMRSVVRANAGSRPACCWLFILEELDPRPLRRRSLQAGNADNGARSSVQPLLRLSLIRPRINSVQPKMALVEGKTFSVDETVMALWSMPRNSPVRPCQKARPCPGGNHNNSSG